MLRVKNLVLPVFLLLTFFTANNALAGDTCWQFDNFPTDYIVADIKESILTKKRLATAYWRVIVCPGCGSPDEHVGRIILDGTFQKDIDAQGPNFDQTDENLVPTLVLNGSILDLQLNSPFVYACFLHIKFNDHYLNTGRAAGGCPEYSNFGVFPPEPLHKVPCTSVPSP
jgi:hypothetical protein